MNQIIQHLKKLTCAVMNTAKNNLKYFENMKNKRTTVSLSCTFKTDKLLTIWSIFYHLAAAPPKDDQRKSSVEHPVRIRSVPGFEPDMERRFPGIDQLL